MASGVQALMLFWLLITAIPLTMAVITSGLGAILFGSFVEILQVLQPTRYFQPSDLVATVVGSVFVCVAIGLSAAFRPETPGQTP